MPFPTTVIQIEAHPVECHRVLFNDYDELTGRRITSTQYASRADALEAWSWRGITESDIIVTDARIDAIRSLLNRLDAASADSGSEGVTFALASHDHDRARSQLDSASIELSHSEAWLPCPSTDPSA
ncbi:hypothetical protein [Leucobacter sp. NPDC077196]|uniref:Uncharacterized protein n=1 Tax=Leucobacter chromiiresistens TaxID=1079994 RepID=A0A1H0YIY3_9MICO|nr:hypothetical protein SAMN04488565_0913 [Leucobacter chromiiresistens]